MWPRWRQSASGRRNDVETRELFASDVMPHVASKSSRRGADRVSGRLHAPSERRLVHDLRGGDAVARHAAGTSGFDFSNAMVVVTGDGAGIGQGIAHAFGRS